MSNKTYSEYDPVFTTSFLHPRHWLTWLGIPFAILLALLPHQLRAAMSRRLARFFVQKNNRAKQRAMMNLQMCYPERSEEEQLKMLEDSFATAGAILLGFAQPFIKGRRYVLNSHKVEGEHFLHELREQNKNIIMLVPHTWAIDFSALYFAAKGMPMVAMVRPQRNPIAEWLMNRQRRLFGGRIYQRNQGIKPYLKSIKDGYLAYYLPDEDHGVSQSVFAPFFGHEKATLKGVGKLAKLSNSAVVPVFPGFNIDTGKFELKIQAPLENFPSGDERTDAIRMNKVLEDMIRSNPEQYMWIMNIFRTRTDGTRRD
ncbi:Lipid A biosynthesis (KDO) 2-(lauroyl)-lipid IVA acyltransferase [Photobacterium marinum]|uniref:Lipid A biosynthesis acyltransferase n=1 Tax=Photobacterium marinum TaxID=1056511 RepID=L8JEP7_9GAMM|nr:lauroyl-Kdo(2)-lipid IV(A) myristoyltransferase [Photobacterium marinum]ELR67290.1 Lipid A biosynthesis (KDO) 2-(lauroyl)-lipid IVA acyltransferase [Photobacterium marinum]